MYKMITYMFDNKEWNGRLAISLKHKLCGVSLTSLKSKVSPVLHDSYFLSEYAISQ